MAKYDAGSTFEQAPVGNHAAILVKVIDIGTQESTYNGEATSRRQEIWTWELPLEARTDGQPFIISKFYTRSLSEKANLYKDLTSWLGKSPDPDTFTAQDVLGKPCQVMVVARDKSDKHVVAGVSALTKGLQIPDKPHNDLVYLSLDPEEFSQEVFDSLTDGLQKMIIKSPEYGKIVSGDAEEFSQAAAAGAGDDDIPF